MVALYLTIFVSLLLAVGFLIFFILSVKSGQYEDAYSPSVRMLFEDDELPEEEKTDETSTEKDKNL
jgi:cbb3-type cytochrome oxidase maturation protein